MRSLAIFSVFYFVSYASGKVNYDGYKVFQVTPTTPDQLKFLKDLSDNDQVLFCDSPTPNAGKTAGILSSPAQNAYIRSQLKLAGLEPEEVISDVQELIDQEARSNNFTVELSSKFFWHKYNKLPEINDWLDYIALTHKETVSLINIGETYEKRPLRLVRISKGKGKKAIFMDANIHAREWITNAVATYFINELLTNPDYASWTDDFDFYIIPMANPDGYLFTHETDRMWRKTRSHTKNSKYFGVDPNRNFDFHWNESGSSPLPNSDTYAGPFAFSESETKAIANYFEKNVAKDCVFFGSIHSASQFILLPFGVEGLTLPQEEKNTYERIASKMAKAIEKRFGTHYIWGSITEILYAATGSTMDWAKGKFDIYLALSFELRDRGTCGFLLPPEQIVATSLEFLDGFQVIIDELRQKFISPGDKDGDEDEEKEKEDKKKKNGSERSIPMVTVPLLCFILGAIITIRSS